MDINIKSFVASYLAAAAFVTCDSDENNNFTREAKKVAEADCIRFINEVTETLGEYFGVALLTIGGKDVPYLAGFDLYLTRNGHGAGFWDSPEKYGEVHSQILTDIAVGMGGCDCYHVRGKKSKLTF